MNPLTLFRLAWNFRRYIAAGIGACVVAWLVHAYGDRRAQEVMARWQAETAAINRATEAANAKARKKEGEALARNEVIEREYSKKIAAAESARDRTLRLLQSARACDPVRTSEAESLSDSFGASEAGRDQAFRRLAELNSAIADLRKEAEQNADQLDALLAEVKPQL